MAIHSGSPCSILWTWSFSRGQFPPLREPLFYLLGVVFHHPDPVCSYSTRNWLLFWLTPDNLSYSSWLLWNSYSLFFSVILALVGGEVNACSPATGLNYKSRWDFDWIREGWGCNRPCRGRAAASLGPESVLFFFALQVNFVLFIGIIVILVQKLQSPDMGGNESSIYL